MKKLTGFVITAGHLDIEWYQPMNSYRFWTVQALTELKEAAKREDFKCYVLDGQVYPLLEHLSVVPEDEAEMRKLIADGSLKIGPFYTQFDEWIPSAENMIRNCLYGKREADRFGGYMSAGYLPDNFGHPMQMPQILNGFGIDSLLFMRGMPEVEGGHPDEFLFEGLDGSKVLCSHFRESYAGAFDIYGKQVEPLQPRESPYYPDYLSYEWHHDLANHEDPDAVAENMVSNVRRIAERYPSGVIPLIAGADHLPPQFRIGECVAAANAMQDDIEFVMGDVEEYIRMVQSRGVEHLTYRTELLGSKYQYILLGVLSTRSYLKRQNFGCEALLEKYAEPITAIAHLHGYRAHPTLLREAWTGMLLNSAHDSIHGSSIDEAHIDMESRFGKARQIASGLAHDAMTYLATKVQPTQNKGCLVYNPIPRGITQPAEVWMAIGDQNVAMFNRKGERMPTQVLPREEVAVNGIGLPRNDLFPAPLFRKVLFMTDGSNDISAYEAKPTQPDSANKSGLRCDESGMENKWIRVDAHGALIDLTDKRSGKTWYGLNLLEEEADAGDAWDFAQPWIPGIRMLSSSFDFSHKVVERGPVRATLRVSGTMVVPACLDGDMRSREMVKIPVSFDISLYRDLPRVDVKLVFDNTASDHRIRLKLNMGVRTDSILSQGHLAVIDRPIHRQKEVEKWYQPPTQLLPCREWIAARDHQTGLAVAMKGMYDYEAVMEPIRATPEVSVTLLRGFQMMGRRNTKTRSGSASEAFVTPDAQCHGRQEIEWSYLPFSVDEQDVAPFLTDAQSFLYPPLTHALRVKAPENGPETIPFPVVWNEKNIQFSALKRAEDGNGTILRLFENQGKFTECTVHLDGFTEASLCRMDESEIGLCEITDGKLKLVFAPYKSVTVRLR